MTYSREQRGRQRDGRYSGEDAFSQAAGADAGTTRQ
jgi:hypothetical protein